MRNRVFFPQAALDEWMAEDRVDLSTEELVIRAEGRKYRIVEAVRVLREVTDASDPNELVGKVKSKAFLAELGAEILEGSMIIGDNAYDIVPGFVGAPIGSFVEHRQTHPEITHQQAMSSDEELLAAFLAQSM
jgi:hypothetical protein